MHSSPLTIGLLCLVECVFCCSADVSVSFFKLLKDCISAYCAIEHHWRKSKPTCQKLFKTITRAKQAQDSRRKQGWQDEERSRKEKTQNMIA